jgi:hypothetical protein
VVLGYGHTLMEMK